MSNMFSAYASERAKDQERIEKSVAPKAKGKRAQFCLALSPEHKQKLKMYALKRGIPVSRVVEEWIDKYAD